LDALLRHAERSDPFQDAFRRNAGDRIISAYAELGAWQEAMDWVERAYEASGAAPAHAHGPARRLPRAAGRSALRAADACRGDGGSDLGREAGTRRQRPNPL